MNNFFAESEGNIFMPLVRKLTCPVSDLGVKYRQLETFITFLLFWFAAIIESVNVPQQKMVLLQFQLKFQTLLFRPSDTHVFLRHSIEFTEPRHKFHEVIIFFQCGGFAFSPIAVIATHIPKSCRHNYNWQHTSKTSGNSGRTLGFPNKLYLASTIIVRSYNVGCRGYSVDFVRVNFAVCCDGTSFRLSPVMAPTVWCAHCLQCAAAAAAAAAERSFRGPAMI